MSHSESTYSCSTVTERVYVSYQHIIFKFYLVFIEHFQGSYEPCVDDERCDWIIMHDNPHLVQSLLFWYLHDEQV